MLGHSVMFAASALVTGLYAMFASGMFPAGARPAPMRGGAGMALIVAGAVLVAAAAVTALRGAWLNLEWPYAVIAGGLGLLVAPVAFQSLPRALQDTPAGAALLCALGGAMLAAWRTIV